MTTLINILMGLLKPSEGLFYIDNLNITESNSEKYIYSWMKKIALVPQDIYLLDDTILKNVAFGILDENIDFNRVNKCLEISIILELSSIRFAIRFKSFLKLFILP